jgi:hypothetical protein
MFSWGEVHDIDWKCFAVDEFEGYLKKRNAKMKVVCFDTG